MAVKVEDAGVPKSTGAVKFDAEPVTVEQTADNTSTGAVKHVPPGTTEVSHYSEDVVVNVPNPEPVTMSVSWLDDVKAKVVTAPVKAEPKKAVARTKAVKAK